jgi:hypothetical protein
MGDGPTYLDYDDEIIILDAQFHGVVWIPTVLLRFVERQIEALPGVSSHVVRASSKRILQQAWETHIMNRPGHAVLITNPNLTEWRDVPLTKENEDDY